MRVCIEGNIGSGKSKVIEALAAAFPDVPCFPEPVDEWRELLDLYYASPTEWAFAFQLKVLLSFQAPVHQQCIVERSPLATRHVFGQLAFTDNHLNQHQWELFKQYHDVLSWQPDVIFYIDTPAETCKDRIQSRGRACEHKLSVDYLRRIEFQYETMLRFTQIPLVRFDGSMKPHDLHAAVIAEFTKYFHTQDQQ